MGASAQRGAAREFQIRCGLARDFANGHHGRRSGRSNKGRGRSCMHVRVWLRSSRRCSRCSSLWSRAAPLALRVVYCSACRSVSRPSSATRVGAPRAISRRALVSLRGVGVSPASAEALRWAALTSSSESSSSGEGGGEGAVGRTEIGETGRVKDDSSDGEQTSATPEPPKRSAQFRTEAAQPRTRHQA